MTRIVQEPGTKGSQKWLQLLINQQPKIIENHLRQALELISSDEIYWRSPLAPDKYSEYSDEDFLEQVSIRIEQRSLESFWPERGPVWDGLATTSRGDVILVEAKSHVAELASSCGAGDSARKLIRESLKDAAEFYGASPDADWLNGFYQYANRLAHLYLLRQLNGIPAWLCFIYFVNDDEMNGPRSIVDWQSEIAVVHSHLGLETQSLIPFVVDVFVDVDKLQLAAKSHESCNSGKL